MNLTPSAKIYTLSLHDALPIYAYEVLRQFVDSTDRLTGCLIVVMPAASFLDEADIRGISAYTALKARVFDEIQDRKSTRLNSSHTVISYAVFCLKKKNEVKMSV